MRHNPQNTPLSKEWRRLEKEGLSPYEIGKVTWEKWPNRRTAYVLIFDRHARSSFTKFAKYLIKQGIAIDYDYESKGEDGQDTSRGSIEISGTDTPVPFEKFKEFNEEAGGPMRGAQWNYEIYDDNYSGVWDDDGRQIGLPKSNPNKLKARLLR